MVTDRLKAIRHRVPLRLKHGVLRIEHVEAVLANVAAGRTPHENVIRQTEPALFGGGADYRIKRALELLKGAGLIRFNRLRNRWHLADELRA